MPVYLCRQAADLAIFIDAPDEETAREAFTNMDWREQGCDNFGKADVDLESDEDPEYFIDERGNVVPMRWANIAGHLVQHRRAYYLDLPYDGESGFGPDETRVRVPNGYLVFPTPSSNPEGTDYVRFMDDFGVETGYWDSQEWVDDPKFVMGAILVTIASGGLHGVDDLDERHERARLERERPLSSDVPPEGADENSSL